MVTHQKSGLCNLAGVLGPIANEIEALREAVVIVTKKQGIFYV